MSEQEAKYEECPKLFSALVKAQAKVENAKKDTANPFFKSKYADLASVTEAIRPVCAEFGLAYFQRFHDHEGGVAIETIILHESGEQLSNGVLRVPASKQDAQGYGSAITYARRYSLQTAFGVAPEDDDGNAAAKTATQPPPSAPDYDAMAGKSVTAGWIGEMEGAAANCSVSLFRGWWPKMKDAVTADCGESGAAEVFAAWKKKGVELAEQARPK